MVPTTGSCSLQLSTEWPSHTARSTNQIRLADKEGFFQRTPLLCSTRRDKYRVPGSLRVKPRVKMVSYSAGFWVCWASLCMSLGVGCRERDAPYHLATSWSPLNVTTAESYSPPPRESTVPSPQPATTCPGCVSSRANIESSLTNPELTSLRIEFIKQQILEKLRLKEPPTVKSSTKLPKSLVNNPGILKRTEDTRKMEEEEVDDDFYGKTDQVILFPQEGGNARCTYTASNPSVCFVYNLPSELQADEVTTAEFWLYKNKDSSDEQSNGGQDFVLSEISHSTTNNHMDRTARIATEKTTLTDGWVKFDLAFVVKNWLEYRELSHAIQVVCTTCSDLSKAPISLEPDHKPFLVINTDTLTKSRRTKRNTSCAPGVTECCRENLYISFAAIGWDDWIISPVGYDAYFCRGSCSNAASITLSGSHYNSVIRKLIYQGTLRGQKLELVPCCTATRLSSIQLLYKDNNETYTYKTLPNMVVDSCGCM